MYEIQLLKEEMDFFKWVCQLNRNKIRKQKRRKAFESFEKHQHAVSIGIQMEVSVSDELIHLDDRTQRVYCCNFSPRCGNSVSNIAANNLTYEVTATHRVCTVAVEHTRCARSSLMLTSICIPAAASMSDQFNWLNNINTSAFNTFSKKPTLQRSVRKKKLDQFVGLVDDVFFSHNSHWVFCFFIKIIDQLQKNEIPIVLCRSSCFCSSGNSVSVSKWFCRWKSDRRRNVLIANEFSILEFFCRFLFNVTVVGKVFLSKNNTDN